MKGRRRKTCGQCGQPWSARACGPSHALVFHEIEIASIRRLKQRIANATWRCDHPMRRKINAAIDAWAAAERKRSR